MDVLKKRAKGTLFKWLKTNKEEKMIYTIGDLHIGFAVDKPMDIFGDNWKNHAEKIKQNWLNKVNNEDTVIMPGDFSWGMDLDEAKADFEFLNNLPGKKILLKGNHDYWWNTVKKMNKFLEDNNLENINFLYNNSYLVENKVIVGTKGWTTVQPNSEDNYRILKRECQRLELSIKDAIKHFGDNDSRKINEFEIIAFMHYPPFYKEEVNEEIDFIRLMNKYGIKKCYYGHLHGEAHKEAIEGIFDGIDFKLVSSDYLNFDLLEI